MSQNLGALTVTLEAQTKQLQQQFGAAAKALKDFEKASKDQERVLSALEGQTNSVGKAMQGTSAGISSMAIGFMGLKSALQTVASVMKDVYGAVEEGARASAAEAFFRNAGKSIGEYRAATHGLISDADLMKKANLADSMGVNEQTFKSLAQVAQAASLKTGQSFDYMFNSIIVGTARSSRLLLDNLGIIVSVKTANENYAKSLKDGADAGYYRNKSIEQIITSLTDVEKKEAFANEVMKQSKDMLQENADAGELAAQKFDRLAASSKNLATVIQQSLVTSMGSFVDEIADGVQALADMIKKTSQLTFMQKAKYFAAGVADQITRPFEGVGLVDAGLSNVEKAGQGAQDHQTDVLIMMSKQLQDSGVTWKEALAMSGVDVQNYSDLYGKEIADLITGFRALNKQVVDSPFVLRDRDRKRFRGPAAAGEDEETPTEKRAREKAEKKANKEFYDPDAMHGGSDLFRNLETKVQDQIQKLADAEGKYWQDRIEFWEKFHRDQHAADLKAAMDLKAAEATRDYNKVNGAASEVAQYGGALAAGDAAGVLGGIGSMIADALLPGLGPVGELIGRLVATVEPVVNLFMDVAEGIRVLLNLGFTQFLSVLEPLGDALKLLLGTVGLLIGSALRPFIPVMEAIVAIAVIIIDAFAVWFTILSPFVELIVGIFTVLGTALAGLLGFTKEVGGFGAGLDYFTDIMLGATVAINNGIVNFVRSLGLSLGDFDFMGLADFGVLVDKDYFKAPLDENTEATEDNTRATRDLIREFRNLPQGYKVASAIYQSTAPRQQRSDGVAGTNKFGTSPRDFFRTGT